MERTCMESDIPLAPAQTALQFWDADNVPPRVGLYRVIFRR